MKEVRRLLKNPDVAAKLRSAKSPEAAAKLIVKAGKDTGVALDASEVAAWFKAAPRKDLKRVTHPELMEMMAIKTTWETKLTACSQICCYTCRTSQIMW